MMQDYEIAAQELASMAAELGLSVECRFIPYSQSRNAKEGWQSLNWDCSIMRNGKPLGGLANVDYGQGVGHCPADKYKWAYSHIKARALALEIETGKIVSAPIGRNAEPRASARPIPTPSVTDILAAICRDSDALDYASFEQWAAELGYEADSRKAESIYRQCLSYGLALRAAIGETALAKLCDLANRL